MKDGLVMDVNFDIEAIKEKVKSFTPKKDRLSAAVQLAICVAGVVLVLIHELKGLEKNKYKN